MATPTSPTSSSSASASLLAYKPDHYQGVLVDAEALPIDPTRFAAQLEASLATWRHEKKRGIWLKLPLTLASHVPLAAAAGFAFHHAEPAYVMMTHWLDTTHPSTLPPGPTHQVGVGALVLDESGTRILAVQEKSGPLQGSGVWKMPTGLLDVGEDIGAGAEREVREETGVTAVFRSVVAFRHAHDFAFGKTSDLFFVVRLQVQDATLRPCPREIEACAFIPLAEFLGQPRFQASPLYACVYDLCRDVCGSGGEGEGVGGGSVPPPPSIMGTRLEMGFRPGTALLYHTSLKHHEKHEKGEEDGNGV